MDRGRLSRMEDAPDAPDLVDPNTVRLWNPQHDDATDQPAPGGSLSRMSLRDRQIEVGVDALDDRGRGVGTVHDTNQSVRVTVPGLVPGERASAKVTWQHRRFAQAHARPLALLEACPDRRSAPCPRHDDPLVPGPGRCTGCPLQSIEVEAQRQIKLARVREQLGIAVESMFGGEPWGYRWSAKRVVAGRPGALILGSRRPRGYAIADMAGCLVDHPRIVETADALVRTADELAIEPFDAEQAAGELRYVWFKTDGERVLVTLLVGRGDATDRAAELAKGLASLDRAVDVAVSVQGDTGNAIRGGPAEPLVGPCELDVDFGELGRVRAGPLGFLQPNPQVAALAYAALLEGLPSDDGSEVFDLYAGAGLTTRWLRTRFERVRAVETYPESAAALGVEPADAESFAIAAVAEGRQPRIVVANPPRGGMGAAVSAALRQLGPEHLRIMSCRPETLVRDLEVLRAVGEPGATYRVTRATAYDTLPHTAHLELVAWLERET